MAWVKHKRSTALIFQGPARIWALVLILGLSASAVGSSSFVLQAETSQAELRACGLPLPLPAEPPKNSLLLDAQLAEIQGRGLLLAPDRLSSGRLLVDEESGILPGHRRLPFKPPRLKV